MISIISTAVALHSHLIRHRHSKILQIGTYSQLIQSSAFIARIDQTFPVLRAPNEVFTTLASKSFNQSKVKNIYLSDVKVSCKLNQDNKKANEIPFFLKNFGFFFDERDKDIFKTKGDTSFIDMYVNLANVSEIKFEDSFLVIKVAQNEIYYLLASNNKLEETYKATVTDLNNYSKDLKIIMKTKLIEQTNSSHESGLKENTY